MPVNVGQRIEHRCVVTLEKAKQEFNVRLYLWAGSEWEREIADSFPTLQKFKSGSVWQTYQFIRRLGQADQFTTARGLLKRFHTEAVKALGETCTREEESLRFLRDDFFRIRTSYQIIQGLEATGQQAEADVLFQMHRADFMGIAGEPYFNDKKSLLSRLDGIYQEVGPSFEEKLALRKKAGEKIKFANKRKLQSAITDKFKQTFGTQCLNHEFDDVGDPHSRFDIKCGGWILSTSFWFGRGKNLINYNQSISSEEIFEQHGPNGLFKAPRVMAIMISLTSWLGITSQIQWEYITPDETDSTCEEVMKQVSHFADVAPKLLKGLDVEKITVG